MEATIKANTIAPAEFKAAMAKDKGRILATLPRRRQSPEDLAQFTVVRKWIYIDVDGTLCPAVVKYARQCRAADNVTVLWSARGEDHARRAAEKLDALDAFDFIQSKPAVIVDDQGWSWIKFTQAIHPRRLKNV